MILAMDRLRVMPLLGPAVFPGQNEAGGAPSWHSEVAYGVRRGGDLVGSPYGGVGGTSGAIEEARVGYRIEPDTPQAENMRVDVWTDPVAGNEEKRAGAGLTWVVVICDQACTATIRFGAVIPA